MCYDLDSRPPIERIAGGAHDGESLTLTSEDGTPFQAYLARPIQPTGAGMLVLPDVRGLHPFFEELALRFAERGVTALAIDYFGRTAGTGARGDDFDYRPHVDAMRWGSLQADIRTGAAYLRSIDDAPGSIFTTGFCVGGRLSSNSATLGLGLAGVVPFYGWPVGASRDIPAPAEVAGRIECPVLALYGGADDGIPAEARAAYDRALDAAGIEHESVVYPGATHSFFDRKAGQFADASADAWTRLLDFIGRHAVA